VGEAITEIPLAPGEDVVLFDAKGRRYLIKLRNDGRYHSHAGIIEHADIIGMLEGSVLKTSKGLEVVVFRPTLLDRVMEMPRGAQIIYPKDLGSIVVHSDIAPGMKVLEAGVGSGALSMMLVRAGAIVYGYELREDFAQRAEGNIKRAFGESVNWQVTLHDIYEGIDLSGLDRILLDLPEPWHVVEHAERALLPGGILLSYLPSMDQVIHLRQVLEKSRFGLVSTYEVLQRGWHIEDRSVRPDHRMVAHTGFITVARLMAVSSDKFRSWSMSPVR
jgi:tRNA (adenine57-N1/adenine58-N1)-methyltransferase